MPARDDNGRARAVWALVVKDIRVSFWILAAIVAVGTPLGLRSLANAQSGFWLTLGLTAALAAAPLGVEWRCETERLIASFPVGRADSVTARYLATIAASVVAVLLMAGYGQLLAATIDARHADAYRWIGLDAGIAAFAAATMTAGVFLPCYFALGLGRGIRAFILIQTVIVAVAFALRGTDRAGVAMPILIGLAARVRARLGTAGFCLGSVAGMAAAYWVSWRLAVWFYGRRDL